MIQIKEAARLRSRKLKNGNLSLDINIYWNGERISQEIPPILKPSL